MNPEQLTPAGVLDLTNLPEGARAMTRAGRPFNKAAEELHRHLARRIQVLTEYEIQMQKLTPIWEELVRSHTRIDQIIDEMSPVPLKTKPDAQK